MSGYWLKIIAVVLMLVDHIGYIFFYGRPEYDILRGMGRLVFPIFAFLIAEGCCHTGNKKNYLARLLAFAFISEPFYDQAFFKSWVDFSYQNIFFTLFLGAAASCSYSGFRNSSYKGLSYLIPPVACLVGEGMRCDYGAIGVALIFFLFLTRTSFLRQSFVITFSNIALVFKYSSLQVIGILSVIPLYFYNGQRGKNIKYFFYIFYPAHLAVLSLIRVLLE